MKYAYRRFAVSLLGSTALALASLPLTLSTASAQVNCTGLTATGCAQAAGAYQVLQQFQTLPTTPAGLSALRTALSAVEGIYLNATPAQRLQAVTNSVTGPLTVPAQNIWSMLTPSNQIFPTLQAFPQLQTSSALATAIGTQLAVTPPSGVYAQIATLIGSIGGVLEPVIVGTKDSFTAYAQAYQGMSTQFASPQQIDPRPYQVSQVIANNPWTTANSGPGMPQEQANQWAENQTSGSFPSGHSTMGNTSALLYAIMVPQAYQSLMVSAQQFGLSRNILGVHHPLDIIGGRLNAYYVMTQFLAGNPTYSLGINNFQTYTGVLGSDIATSLGAVANVPYASCANNMASCIANGTIPTAAQFTAANQAYALQATYGLPSIGATNAAAVVPQNAELLIASRFPYLSSAQLIDVLATTELPSGGLLDDGSGWVRLNLFAAAGGYGAFNSAVTVTMNAAQGGFNAIDVWSNNIGGSGSLTKLGTGTLVLAGNNSYTGGTVVGGGTLALTGTMIGNLSILPGASFVSGGGYSVSSASTLSNAGTFQSVNASLVNQGTLANSGTMLSDIVNLGTATNTNVITGNVSNGGTFTNNGLVNGTFTNTGVLGGSGTMVGNVSNSAVVGPGNSIGTLSVAGNYTHSGSASYQAEVSGTGQSDLINIGGTATLQGGSVYVYATPGAVFAPTTTYRILNAAGGLSGTFASVNELYPFLQSSLSYDANNAYLTLQIGGFAAAAATPTQAAVGNVLDANINNATGDFAAVLSSMAVNTLSTAQGQATLQALSGNNYAGFSTSMVLGMQLFMNNFANQTGGGGSPVSNRVALAEACDVACDSTTPPKWGAWGGALGGLGTIGANQPVGTVTYNVGGFAAGLDQAITVSFRMGVTAGYTTGNQWIGGFDGKGTTDTFQVGLYGSFAQDKVYADGLIGYAYSWNQMWRNIPIPGLPLRTAQGRAGANQWYGQLETGYRFDLGTNANAFITPFARLQAYTANQNAFTETGAQSLNLSVAQQTTNSLRSVIGAQLGGSMDLGWREKLAMQLRLGWSHEYADTARPVSATLAGAPVMPFTTFGVAPQRDGVVLGLSANTAIAEATSIYLRYESDISGQDSAHALTAGVRMTW